MPLDTKNHHVPTSRLHPVEYRKIIKKLLVMEVSATDEGQRIWRSIIGVFLLIGVFFVLVGFSVGSEQLEPLVELLSVYILFLTLFFTFVLIYEFLYAATYYYDIGETFIRIRKGVLLRREVSIPYHQIQDVNVDQDFLDHILRLYDVHISTATEKYLLDPHIDGLSYQNAERILQMIHAEIEDIQRQPAAPAIPVSVEK